MHTTRTALFATTLAAAVALNVCGSASSCAAPGLTGHTSGRTPHVRTDRHKPLARIVDQRRELPKNFEVSRDPGPVLPRAYDGMLHRCLGVPTSTSLIVGRASAEASRDAPGYTAVGVVSTATRYRTRAAAERESALVAKPQAGRCYRAVLLRLFRREDKGTGIEGGRTTVRGRKASEPGNVIGVVTFRFRSTIGLKRRGQVTLTYITGPSLSGCIGFVGYGRHVGKAVRHRMTTAFAARVAKG